jgi:hypothetical protein
MGVLKVNVNGVWEEVAGGSSGGVEEVAIQTSDPGPTYDLWYDTDDTTTATQALSGFSIPVACSTAPEYMKDFAAAIGTELGIPLVCTGTNDEQIINGAIQAAYDTATHIGLGGKVMLSNGEFFIGGSIVMKIGVHLTGQGHGATLITASNPESAAIWPRVALNEEYATTGPYAPQEPFWSGTAMIRLIDPYPELGPDDPGGGQNQTFSAPDAWRISELTLNGGSNGSTYTDSNGHINGITIAINSNNSSNNPIVGPDNMGMIDHVGIASVSCIGLFMPDGAIRGYTNNASGPDGITGAGALGGDAQAIHLHNIRIYRTGFHGAYLGPADLMASNLDIGSTGNRTFSPKRVSCGVVCFGGNLIISDSKAWYCKTGGLTSADSPTLSGTGWYIGTGKVSLMNLEAQEAENHGFVLRNCRGVMQGLCANSCGTDTTMVVPGVGTQPNPDLIDVRKFQDAAGFYLIGGNGGLVLDGQAYNQRPATPNGMAYGVRNDVSVPNSFIRCTFYTEGHGGTPPPVGWNGQPFDTTTLHWIGGTSATPPFTNITQIPPLALPQETYKYRTAAAPTITGTTLTEDTGLRLVVAGGAKWYEIEALIYYNGDATGDTKIGIQAIQLTGTAGTVELRTTGSGEDAALATKNYFQYGTSSTMTAVQQAFVFGANGTGAANQRAARFVGTVYAGSVVGTVAISVIRAENVAATGVIINSPSFLKVTAINSGVIT